MYFCLLSDPKILFPFETVRRTQKRGRVGGREREGQIEKCLLEVLRRPPPPAPAPPSPPPPPPPPPPASLSEDEHFFKGIIPSLQRLPPHAKEHIQFQIYKLLHDANNFYNPGVLNLDSQFEPFAE